MSNQATKGAGLIQETPPKDLGITNYQTKKEEAQGLIAEVQKKLPPPTPEQRAAAALEKIGAELELINRFLVVLPELIVAHAIMGNRGALPAEEVVRSAEKFTNEFFKAIAAAGEAK